MLNSLILASALALAAENRQMRSVEALIHIDESGKVQQLDWLHPDQVSSTLGAYLKPEVLAIEFEPAQKNGQATYSELLLNVVIEAVQRSDGRSDVRFVSVEKAGPRMLTAPRMNYPEEMLMSGISAYVMLSVEVGADGRAQFDHLENVGGVTIGGKINVPFVFCVENCDAINAQVAKLRAEQVFIPSVTADVKFASIKANATPKAAAGS